MPRQNMKVSPSHKNFHSYNDFTGGLNTVDTDEKLKDNEFPTLLNVDIGDRGSLRRRTGFINHRAAPLDFTWKNLNTIKWSDLSG